MKKLCFVLAVLVFVCTAAVPALAAQTGMPVNIAGSTYYDPMEKAFLYFVDAAASQAVRSSVADGMITGQPVSGAVLYFLGAELAIPLAFDEPKSESDCKEC